MDNIKLKVCGMKFLYNMKKVAQLKPDYMGFIFYEKSRRYMADTLTPEDLKGIPKRTKKVGVFVDASLEEVERQATTYQLDLLQLHGNESPEYCAALKEKGFLLIKVFSIGEDAFDFEPMKAYKPHVKYFLFDTKGKQPGGNGTTFDWSMLRKYDQEVPFFLSGGVGMENIDQLKALKYYNIHAVDVNSRFEIEPGLKDIDKLKAFIEAGNGKQETVRGRPADSIRETGNRKTGNRNEYKYKYKKR